MNTIQQRVVETLKKDHDVDRATVNTLEAGSVMVILWKRGEVHDKGRFRVTRTGKIKQQ
jgi:predicted transcriptional regulator